MKTPKVKVGDWVHLVWEDAWSSASWVWPEDAKRQHGEPYTVHEMGCVVKVDRAGITLTSARKQEGSFRGVMFIPKGMIKTVKKVKLPETLTKHFKP